MSIEKLIEKWRSERAHTYASENADRYRGFESGRQRSADELEAELPAIRELVEAARAICEAVRNNAAPIEVIYALKNSDRIDLAPELLVDLFDKLKKVEE